MDIEQLADACGGLAWISEWLFEVEGRLATGPVEGSPLDAGSRTLLARSSRRYGQHAQWWRAALPDSSALAGPDRIRPPTETWARLRNLVEESAPAEAIVALHGVALPQLLRTLERVMDRLSPISDGAVMRIVRMVHADLIEERSSVEERSESERSESERLVGRSPSSGVSGSGRARALLPSALECLVVEFDSELDEEIWPPRVPDRQ